MQAYTTVKEISSFEYEDRKSVFIGMCAPVSTEKDALAFIEAVKKKYPDARHHVYAYVLRENSTMRFTDDREPQGTAGMPVLDAIRKNGCTDVCIVVTRYFGGTLLGTGGLVRAYTSAAIGALTASNIITYDVYNEISIELSYPDHGKISAALVDVGFRTEDTVYTDGVTVIGKLVKANCEKLISSVTEITSGRAKINILSEKFDF